MVRCRNPPRLFGPPYMSPGLFSQGLYCPVSRLCRPQATRCCGPQNLRSKETQRRNLICGPDPTFHKDCTARSPFPAGPKRLAAAAAVPAVHEVVRDNGHGPPRIAGLHDIASDAITLARAAERADTVNAGRWKEEGRPQCGLRNDNMQINSSSGGRSAGGG